MNIITLPIFKNLSDLQIKIELLHVYFWIHVHEYRKN